MPGELSKLYQALPPQERTKVAQEVNQRFRKLIGNNNLVVDPKNPKDRPIIRLWLQLRDDEMRKRSGLEIIARPLNGLQYVQTTLVGGIEIMKLGIVYKADPYLSLRASANENSEVVAKLDFNARVFIHKDYRVAGIL